MEKFLKLKLTSITLFTITLSGVLFNYLKIRQTHNIQWNIINFVETQFILTSWKIIKILSEMN